MSLRGDLATRYRLTLILKERGDGQEVFLRAYHISVNIVGHELISALTFVLSHIATTLLDSLFELTFV